MALGVNDVKVPWPTVERLITKIKHILRTGERHSKDTCSLFIMALKSVAGQFRDSSVRFNEINRYINMLANALSMKTKVDKDNLWTKSLVMQVCNTSFYCSSPCSSQYAEFHKLNIKELMQHDAPAEDEPKKSRNERGEAILSQALA